MLHTPAGIGAGCHFYERRKKSDAGSSQNGRPLLDGFEGKPKGTTYLQGSPILRNTYMTRLWSIELKACLYLSLFLTQAVAMKH